MDDSEATKKLAMDSCDKMKSSNDTSSKEQAVTRKPPCEQRTLSLPYKFTFHSELFDSLPECTSLTALSKDRLSSSSNKSSSKKKAENCLCSAKQVLPSKKCKKKGKETTVPSQNIKVAKGGVYCWSQDQVRQQGWSCQNSFLRECCNWEQLWRWQMKQNPRMKKSKKALLFNNADADLKEQKENSRKAKPKKQALSDDNAERRHGNIERLLICKAALGQNIWRLLLLWVQICQVAILTRSCM